MARAARRAVEMAVASQDRIQGLRTYVDDLKLSKVGPPGQAAQQLRQLTLDLRDELLKDGMVLELS